MNDELNIYKEMLENLYEGVYFVDTDRKITFWNKGAERISGFSAEEITGNYCYDNILNHVDNDNNELCKNGCPLHKTIEDGQVRQAGVYLHHKNGHRVAVAIRTIPLFIGSKIIGAVEVFIDDLEKVNIQQELNELKIYALYDQLTQLPNRRYIDSFMSNRIKEYKALGISFAVAMIDIDHFKIFNDTYGHDAGDRVLKMISKTLKNAFRKNDFVGRWGGEEFLAILTQVDETNLEGIVEKVRHLVEKSVLRDKDNQLKVTVSIGCTVVRTGDDESTILKRADDAMYQSKNNGRNQTTIL